MKRPFLSTLILPAILILGAWRASAEPQWIWLSKDSKENEKVTLRTEFDLPGAVKAATLMVSCDNGATASINGQTVLQNRDWMSPEKSDAKGFLKPGKNQLVLAAKNNDGVAAAVAVLQIELADGKKLTVETDDKWQAAPAGSRDFVPATAIAKYGAQPWGDVFATAASKIPDGRRRSGGPAQPVSSAESLQLAKGFKAELLYTVPKAEQGSWVALTVDLKGRLLASDQYGTIYRVTPAPIGTADAAAGTKVEQLTLPPDKDGKPLGGAHGLLYAFDSLYFMNNEKSGKGLWRLKDTDGDDQFDKAEFLRKIDGGGEHGPHSIVVSPDGKGLFFCSGNHTKLPENMELSRAARAWQEDHILPRLWDGNGHAKGILAPGGYICKTDPDLKRVELYAYGYRNQYDIAFDQNGELFSFDSDMEWDIGMPWYRPTRIAHATCASDQGWRSGSGLWPEFYPDSVPPALDVGPGSPTGVCFGTGAKFPTRYQRALYALDWTYGTMYAVHLTPHGAGFKAEKEEFVAGKPLPLTDAVIHPKDGAMYFAIGGRRTQSALYRVTYAGPESTAPAAPYVVTPEAKIRHNLEKLHEDGTGYEAIDKAWPYLSHPDRLIRFAARVAIERQPAEKWSEKALSEKNPQAAIEALIALSRVGRSSAAASAALDAQKRGGVSSGPVPSILPEDVPLQKRVLEALGRFDFAKADLQLQFQLIRAWQLAFTRFGKPDAATCAVVAAKFDPLYPHSDPMMNRELVQLLVFLDSPTVVAKTVPQLAILRDVAGELATDSLLARNEGYAAAARTMQASQPNRQAIALAAALRNAKAGWTPELRRTFFAWFPSTRGWKGGNSFPKFMDNIRKEALDNFVPVEERVALDDLGQRKVASPLQNVVMPKGPGRAWSVDDVVKLAGTGLTGRDFEHGKAMYAATLCAGCHKFAGDGGTVGPDLTGSGNRYTIRDLAENIIDPSKVISDQYGSEQIVRKDGSLTIGRVIGEEAGKLMVMASPLMPNELTPVPVGDVKERKVWNVSMMPPGLINSLNEEELKDLVAYLQSGGNPNDKTFKK